MTDPPYGIGIVHGGKIGGAKPFGKGRVGGKGLVEPRDYLPIIGDDKPFDPSHLLVLGKTQIIFGANHFADKLPRSACWIVWDKGVARDSTFSKAELAWVSKGGHVLLYRHIWSGLVRGGSRDMELVDRVHPTQKPVGLFMQILQDFPGEIVLDSYVGSGTTMVACQNLNRKCWGIEISPAYCAVILERMATAFPGIEIKRI